MDGNLYYLNQHLDNVERAEKALERFEREISRDIKEISDIVKSLYYIAKDYEDGYDFTEELQIMLEEVIL